MSDASEIILALARREEMLLRQYKDAFVVGSDRACSSILESLAQCRRHADMLMKPGPLRVVDGGKK